MRKRDRQAGRKRYRKAGLNMLKICMQLEADRSTYAKFMIMTVKG